ncbi:hypothetical protein T492DRAFT_204742 [Pavlovales sp. CCMP2436]|nr:hypothetical protein T492DRAFT_204742 [Pavlovales sp. CCMP2436]|mmetsp:Transcript_42874/g.100617  ORF Transcript_42874/g.100617 Transcript_42874/m.100617 type:complete len:108 (+) Transcript_42874:1156-1479(+)
MTALLVDALLLVVALYLALARALAGAWAALGLAGPSSAGAATSDLLDAASFARLLSLSTSAGETRARRPCRAHGCQRGCARAAAARQVDGPVRPLPEHAPPGASRGA